VEVGELVKMNAGDRIGENQGDEWGIGIIVEIDSADNIAVLWSKVGLSWENDTDLKRVTIESR
jgi:hypothetical protein